MRACPACSFVNPDENRFCSDCQAPLRKDIAVKSPQPLSDKALLAIKARELYLATAPKSSDLTAQQWYNVSKFYPSTASRASAISNRPLSDVGPDNPLDRTAIKGAIFGGPVLDPKRWARDLVARHENGERLLMVQIEFAYQALSREIAHREPGEEG